MEIEAGFQGDRGGILEVGYKMEVPLIDITEVVLCWACVCRGTREYVPGPAAGKCPTVCPAEPRGVQTGIAQLWNPARLVRRDSPPPQGWPGHSGWGGSARVERGIPASQRTRWNCHLDTLSTISSLHRVFRNVAEAGSWQK